MKKKNDGQQDLIPAEPEQTEFFEVETSRPDPQRGFPELWWKGKRPFNGVHYYPAQHKESHGDAVDGWRNQLYWGDNLQVMGHLLRKFRGQIDLVYIDPPFDSGANYTRTIRIRAQQISNDQNSFEEKQYGDIWTNDEYLQYMYERLALIRELLSSKGNLFLHCDYRKNSHLRLLLDEVFGVNCFVNEIVWKRKGGSSNPAAQLDAATDTIYWYRRSAQSTINQTYTKDTPGALQYIQERFTNSGDDGRLFMKSPIVSPNYRQNLIYEYKGYTPPPNGWSISRDLMEKWDREGRLYFPEKGSRIYRKIFLDEYQGQPIGSLWTDIFVINPVANERLGYPTQKPEALLGRIIEIGSNLGDLVFDGFMGSGTTQAVAMKLGRRFIGADINLGAVQTTTKRLLRIIDGSSQEQPQLVAEENGQLPLYSAFDVYTVNQYDIFRNELEARDLLMEALAIRPLPGNDVWHGELGEGSETRLVRFMPINRIATRADLDIIVKNLDWKLLSKRRAELPNKPVLRVSLVCMGHEPELAGLLALEIQKGLGDLGKGAKLDIEVVDILRDKDHIEFKRDSHALVKVKKGKLVIERFYPMNLLQKLSLDKTAVEDWRELVESVFVDFDYDGKVLRPTVTDVAEGKELVRGEYEVPKDVGTIRVKITDLLSDVLEVTVGADHA